MKMTSLERRHLADDIKSRLFEGGKFEFGEFESSARERACAMGVGLLL